MQRTISPEELSRLIDTSPQRVAVIDVRKAHDFDADPNLIPVARHRPPETVDDWLHELDAAREIIVYCVHGHAVSGGVLDRLLAAGLRARLIDGGIEAWKANGGSTVPARAPATPAR